VLLFDITFASLLLLHTLHSIFRSTSLPPKFFLTPLTKSSNIIGIDGILSLFYFYVLRLLSVPFSFSIQKFYSIQIIQTLFFLSVMCVGLFFE
jgi:hypothetical protein